MLSAGFDVSVRFAMLREMLGPLVRRVVCSVIYHFAL